MKPRFIFWTVCLTAVLWASACSPASPPAGVPAAALPSTASPVPVSPVPGSATLTANPAAEATWTPLPVATSRGPDLEATDPTGVVLDFGSLQLVEFFRFT